MVAVKIQRRNTSSDTIIIVIIVLRQTGEQWLLRYKFHHQSAEIELNICILLSCCFELISVSGFGDDTATNPGKGEESRFQEERY